MKVQASTSTLPAPDGTESFIYRWVPEGAPKGAVQIAHGLSEHGGCYARLAEALNAAGWAVYANDHRGHGRTAKSPAELGFFAERDGWRLCLDDLWRLNRQIADAHPGLPIVLIGHSMGSFMAQHFISEHGAALAGAVLSASNGKPPPILRLGKLIARLERLRLGARGTSKLLDALGFGAFNKQFAPARTPFDWLSRDPVEVDRYIADPLCGHSASPQLWLDLMGGLQEIALPERQARIPKELPIYIIAGDRDPVSANTKGLEQLLAAYRAAGLTRVSHRFYPGARHELFNETNRDEVVRDLTAWLDGI
jgi:alpha-beta hydrolase superfamily lysophospholipase